MVSRYRPELDGLRAVAIGLVILDHFAGLWLVDWSTGVVIGWAGVTVFFVLSGYLITSLLQAERDRTGRIDLISFYRRRARRLVPALVFMLVIVTAVGAAGYGGPWQAGLFGSLTYTSSWLRTLHIDLGAFTHTWSLSVEAQFYALWPIVFLLPVRPAKVAALVVALGTASFFALSWEPATYATPSNMAAIAIGSLLALRGAPLAFLRPLAVLAPLGQRAYSLYLWDFPMRLVLGPIVGLVACFVMAELSYRLIEQPFSLSKTSARERERSAAAVTRPTRAWFFPLTRAARSQREG